MIPITFTNDLRHGGVYVARQWTPGIVQRLLEKGFPQIQAEEIAYAAGAMRGEQVFHNLITTDGLGMIGDWAIDIQPTGLTYHAIGTGANPAALTDHQLQTEYTRALYSSRSRSGTVITLNAFYLGSTVTVHIHELGQFGGSASATPNSGTLFSRVLYDYDNSVNAFDLTFDYNLTSKNDPSNT
jgi:hypothetical protein